MYLNQVMSHFISNKLLKYILQIKENALINMLSKYI
jgi:hypothetical protein